MMRVVVKTAPAALPVDLDQLKEHAVIEHDLHDAMVQRMTAAVVAQLDPPYGWLGRAMIEQTLTAHLKFFPGSEIYLPYPPLQSVTSIKYVDLDGVTQTVDSGSYEVITTEPGYVALLDGESWPDDLSEIEYPVFIEYVAGYGESYAHVPALIQQYIMVCVTEAYNRRELSDVASINIHPEWKNMLASVRFRMPEVM